MAITYKKQNDLEKMLEEFASFEKLEEVEFPDTKPKVAEQKADGK
ncbi:MULTISPECIES: SPJ_0845 family protein [Streptococcus]|uniref:SPJ_0845 family protein n=1 Tax=Streptococcus ruminantium TaxID=1917441 RepID=A0A2Z5TLS7_9STRE|nr:MULTISPECIES: SPJ_0845 family protein [Streptococcus]MDQ8758967.1 SPJ_0845 family protein [Streptococcus ruminantium]MDQ8765268.1 SPJ_0845 family protein [Streptococcus ruminantium]MDQ8770024.1 SPJ_0845 family protein [Streptococcus ruminantium]MDQ8774269.1 SPJ_0845 family protein [Streptococcus ruminantium]MDQ8781187.1 SPJ_0845 family protein [Streptococcus ruminantium]